MVDFFSGRNLRQYSNGNFPHLLLLHRRHPLHLARAEREEGRQHVARHHLRLQTQPLLPLAAHLHLEERANCKVRPAKDKDE